MIRLAQINFGAGIALLLVLIGAASRVMPSAFAAGDPSAGLVGAIFLLAALLYFPLRRTGIPSLSKRVCSDLHVLLGAIGIGLILAHSGAVFFGPAGLSTLALTLVFFFGLNLRFLSGRQVYRNLSSRAHLFTNPCKGMRRLDPIVQAKKALLQLMNPGTAEGTFGLRVRDWIGHPWKAGRYLWLVQKERKWIRQVGGASPGYLRFSQGWGRGLHIVLAAAVMIGLLFHLFRSCPYFVF